MDSNKKNSPQTSIPPGNGNGANPTEKDLVLDTVGVGIAHVKDTTILWANRRMAAIFGYATTELTNVDCAELFPSPDDVGKLAESSRSAFEAGETYVGEWNMRRKDGTALWARLSGTRIESSDDADRGATWVFEDITAEKAAQERLRLADAIFETTTEGILVSDAKNRIVAANPAFTTITGYSREEVIGHDPGILGSGRHDPEFFENMWRTLDTDGHWEGEVWNRRKNGELFAEWLSVSAIRDDDGAIEYYVAMFSDITKRKQDAERIIYQANYDGLTGLPNRRLLQDRVHQALSEAARSDEQVGILYLDIDNFKFVNDSMGHNVGDALLVEVARRMKPCLREHDTVGRLGGDEFLVVLTRIHSAEETTFIARRVLDAVAKPLSLEGGEHDIVVTASIGIAIYPDDAVTSADIIRNADTAAFHAKEVGRNTYQFFTEDMNVRAQKRLTLENKMRRALDRGEYVLHYQPKVELRRGHIVGAEALVRWENPEEGLVPPDQFIPLAEETGLIIPLGEWVMHEACRRAKAWQDDGLPPMRVAVNLSTKQLAKPDLIKDVARILEETGLSSEFLEIEITESALMEHPEDAMSKLSELREMGIALSADDFGTGYSSLNYLRSFPLDAIKIDRSFVADIGGEGGSDMLAAAIIAIGQSLDMKVIAEGVENQNQLAFLRQQWCDEIQGFFFSKPVPADEFEEMLRSDRRL